MNKLHIFGILALAGMSLTSCNDFLNDNRFPMSQQTVNSDFWSNETNVQNQINYFYEDFAGYGNGSSTNGTFYYSWLSDDQCGRNTFADWKFKTVPSSSDSWNAPYREIRRANEVIQGVESSSLNEAQKQNFIGLARMYRARGYFDLVRRYGDVPLVTVPLDPSDDAELYGPRTARNQVMDFVLEDINYACNNIATQSSKTTFSRDLAYAMKVEMCLFEGSYAKYHANDAARAQKFFGEAVAAGEAIIGRYPVGNDYVALYKSVSTGEGGYPALTANSEVIFCKMYMQGIFMHSLQDYSSASDGVAGITKDAFDSYLFLDGRPAATTTLDNTDAGVAEGDNAMSIANLLAVRDQRLAATTYDHICMPGMAYQAVNTTGGMWSMTGYGVAKFNNFTTLPNDVNTANRNYVCAPLFWGARVALAIAEAKAELGTLTDADVNKYIKPLWERAGIDTSNLNVAYLSNMNDPRKDADVSSLLWEIRRCRRCELIMDDDIRYWDLIRWHKLDKLDTTTNPNIVLGANITNSPVPGMAVTGNYLNCSYGNTRKFENKYYFYPVPSDQIQLNDKLTQNPGWGKAK
ncbi:MAG: RagB/SusD family nutrient uptake outer membrane protein [Muribaculaceae bacterium]|nr:RagB/SusD family nutrient uptake outer membrane protein [Muribaculaceae bacterium]